MHNRETDMLVDKMKLVVEKLEKLVSSLNGKNYDFTKYFSADDLIDNFAFKIDNFEYEKRKQDKLKAKVKEVINDDNKKYLEELAIKNNQSFDECFENSIRVEDFGNYYILWLYGIASFDVNFVFDNYGNLFFDNAHVLGVDEDNFFVFTYDIKEMRDKLYHFQMNEYSTELLNVLDDVVDIDYNDFFCKDLVVCSLGDERMLYNYKNREIVIPSYSSLVTAGELENKNCIRVIKNIYGIDNYKSIVLGTLEFLVDRKGKIKSSICAVNNDYFCDKLLPYYGETQEEQLNYVYKDASKMCNLHKLTRKQN